MYGASPSFAKSTFLAASACKVGAMHSEGDVSALEHYWYSNGCQDVRWRTVLHKGVRILYKNEQKSRKMKVVGNASQTMRRVIQSIQTMISTKYGVKKRYGGEWHSGARIPYKNEQKFRKTKVVGNDSGTMRKVIKLIETFI